MLTSEEFFDTDERTEKISNEIADLFADLDIGEYASYEVIEYTVNATLKILNKRLDS